MGVAQKGVAINAINVSPASARALEGQRTWIDTRAARAEVATATQAW